MSFDWKAVVRTVAPAIGTALGTPVTGMAVKFLADAFLGKPDATEEEVAAAVQGATPDQMLKLKQLDLEFKTKMKQLDIDVFAMEVDDRKSARDLAKVNMVPQVALSVIYSIGYFILLWQFVSGTVVIPLQNKDLLLPLLGVMTAAQVQIMNFWFGSSAGSKTKDFTPARAA